MRKTVTLIFLTTVLAGCERYNDVEIEIPYKPKIVTACFLQAEVTDVQIAVTRSQPVFNTTPKPGFEPAPEYIKDATVMLQQGYNIYFLTYDQNSNLYQASLPSTIKAGERFELTITSGDETSKGSTVIPGKVNASIQVKFDSVFQADGLYQYLATITCTPTDPGKHYLQFYPILSYGDTIFDAMYSQTIASVTELSQGQSATKTYVSTSSMNGMSPDKLEVMIVNCDEGFTKNSNIAVDMLGNIGLAPFLMDPAITYTNMTGGIGLIGSYNAETRYSFNLK